jgi:hypothetical protein
LIHVHILSGILFRDEIRAVPMRAPRRGPRLQDGRDGSPRKRIVIGDSERACTESLRQRISSTMTWQGSSWKGSMSNSTPDPVGISTRRE